MRIRRIIPWLWLWLWLWLRRCINRLFSSGTKPFGKRRVKEVKPLVRSGAKPPWVVDEILRMKALMPHSGCRRIADLFNRRFADTGISVGKSLVNDKIREHHLAVLRMRMEIRKRKLKATKPNRVWGMDLTGKTDSEGKCHSILALVDHGTRANLRLLALPDKRAFTLAVEVIYAVLRYGRPRAIRTDNEAVFTSRLFTTVLRLLSIKHQISDLGCPWQNGRVERFFGTLKRKLDHFTVDSPVELNGALGQFRLWYNHIRPHQSLQGRTPAEVWSGEQSIPLFNEEHWFEAWDGLLQGYYLRR